MKMPEVCREDEGGNGLADNQSEAPERYPDWLDHERGWWRVPATAGRVWPRENPGGVRIPLTVSANVGADSASDRRIHPIDWAWVGLASENLSAVVGGFSWTGL